MRYLSVILWLLLGLLYYWIWSSNQASCCNSNGISRTEQVAPAADASINNDNTKGEALTADKSTNNDANSAADQAAKDAAAKADADAVKAIAEAEKTKEVTSVTTTDASGVQKLTFYFPYGSNSASYSSGTEADLRKLVDNAKSSGKKIVVSGHTDSDSSSEFNMRLGKRRADRVRSKIISMGLNSNQVEAVSFGETKPVASNNTEEGKQKNRRVELIIE